MEKHVLGGWMCSRFKIYVSVNGKNNLRVLISDAGVSTLNGTTRLTEFMSLGLFQEMWFLLRG